MKRKIEIPNSVVFCRMQTHELTVLSFSQRIKINHLQTRNEKLFFLCTEGSEWNACKAFTSSMRICSCSATFFLLRSSLVEHYNFALSIFLLNWLFCFKLDWHYLYSLCTLPTCQKFDKLSYYNKNSQSRLCWPPNMLLSFACLRLFQSNDCINILTPFNKPCCSWKISIPFPFSTEKLSWGNLKPVKHAITKGFVNPP